MAPLLEIKNLHAMVDGKPILRGIDLTLQTGEVNAIMTVTAETRDLHCDVRSPPVIEAVGNDAI